MNEQRRPRRWEGYGPLRQVPWPRVLKAGGILLGAFLLGYLVTALLFFRDSDRPAVVSVPDLRELPLDEARARVQRLDLVLELGDSLPNPRVPEGRVLAQTPLPGHEVAPGTPVRILVSAGRERRPVPDVADLPIERATRILNAAGFAVETREMEAPQPAGSVVAMDPQPGTRVRVPDTVRITVSTGPPRVAVPDVRGMGEQEARAALEAVGLRAGEIEYEYHRWAMPPVVLWQGALPGDSIPEGEAVPLRVATAQPAGPDPQYPE